MTLNLLMISYDVLVQVLCEVDSKIRLNLQKV